MKDKRIQVFEDYSIPKAVFKLAMPSVIGMLVVLAYNVADTLFVGMLNSAVQTAAVSLVAPVMLAFNALNNLFGVGGSSLMGRAMGEKDYDTVARSSAFSIWGAVICGLLFSAAIFIFENPLMNLLGASADNWEVTKSYLFYTSALGAMPSIVNVVMTYMIKTEGSAMAASIGAVLGCGLNVILDPFFILPQYLGMGAGGAGLATLISNIVTCVFYVSFILIRGKKSFVCLDPRKAIPTRKIFKGVVSVGLPSAIQNLLNVTGMTILNNFAATFGSAAVSAVGIAHKICLIPLYIAMGISSGANPLVAYNYGAKNYSRSKGCVKFTSLIGEVFCLAVMVCYLIFPSQLMSLFIKDAEIVAYGAAFIKASCLAIPFQCMDFIGVGVYQAFGKGRLALLFAIGRKAVLEIPALFILNKLYPFYGLAYAQPCAEFVLGIAAVIVLIFMFKKLEKEQSGETAIR